MIIVKSLLRLKFEPLMQYLSDRNLCGNGSAQHFIQLLGVEGIELYVLDMDGKKHFRITDNLSTCDYPGVLSDNIIGIEFSSELEETVFRLKYI